MSRWISLMTKEGAKDKYAVGFVTHIVSKTFSNGKPNIEAWRCAAEPHESVMLGIFHGENAFEMAKLCVENDVRAQRLKGAA